MNIDLDRNFGVIELTAGGNRKVWLQTDDRARAHSACAELVREGKECRVAGPFTADPFESV